MTVAQPANAAIDGFTAGQLLAPTDYSKEFVVTGLQPDTEYVFEVTSLDINGNQGDATPVEIVGTTLAASAPGAPTIDCTTTSTDRFEVTITVLDNGCLPIDRYELSQDGVSVYSGAVPNPRLDDLRPGVDYTFTAKVANAIGESPETTEVCRFEEVSSNSIVAGGVMVMVSVAVTLIAGVLSLLVFA